MKKLAYLLLLLAGFMFTFSNCEKDDPDPITPVPTDSVVVLKGNLESQTLVSTKKYRLEGQVFVGDGKVLTIEPGTVIFGDKATRATLIIDKGGKLDANGTAAKPIVFTSGQAAGIRDRGDWGGLVILGRANVNQPSPAIEGITPQTTFGTNGNSASDGESSGTLNYVRVEFAGIELTPNNETNSITLGGVGRGTKMENCQVSFGGDDGYEWFGGAVNAKNLISFCTWDDDFDVDYGFSGNVQFALAVRYPGYADQSQSNSFECDNGPNDNDVQPYTTGTFSNITAIGPIKTGNATSNANYGHSIDLRRRTAVSIVNSVFAGFPIGMRMNQPSVYENYATAGRGILKNNLLIAPKTSYAVGTGVVVADVAAFWEANNTIVTGDATDAKHTDAGINPDWFFGSRLASAYPAAPNFVVAAGTSLTGASFTDPKFSEPNRTGFFQTVAYRGAFGATNWTSGWAEFNPVTKAY